MRKVFFHSFSQFLSCNLLWGGILLLFIQPLALAQYFDFSPTRPEEFAVTTYVPGILDKHLPFLARETMIKIPNTPGFLDPEAFAYYRQAFPTLRSWSDSEILKWHNARSVMSPGQDSLHEIFFNYEKGVVPSTQGRKKIDGYRLPASRRGSAIPTELPEGGYVDLKGTGIRPEDPRTNHLPKEYQDLKTMLKTSSYSPETKQLKIAAFKAKLTNMQHATGLLTLDDALRETLIGRIMEMYFDLYNLEHGTNFSALRTYGFTILEDISIDFQDGRKMMAAQLVREANIPQLHQTAVFPGIGDVDKRIQTTTDGKVMDFASYYFTDSFLTEHYGNLQEECIRVAQAYEKTREMRVIENFFQEKIAPIRNRWIHLPAAETLKPYRSLSPRVAQPKLVPQYERFKNAIDQSKSMGEAGVEIRTRVARSLIVAGPNEGKTFALLELLVNDPEPKIRSLVIDAIKRVRPRDGPESVSLLHAMIQSKYEDISGAAKYFLGGRTDVVSEQALAEIALKLHPSQSEPYAKLADEAVAAILFSADERHVERLERLLNDNRATPDEKKRIIHKLRSYASSKPELLGLIERSQLSNDVLATKKEQCLKNVVKGIAN